MALLTYLYDASGADPDELVPWRAAMAAAGIEDRDEFIGQLAYLKDLGLARWTVPPIVLSGSSGVSSGR